MMKSTTYKHTDVGNIPVEWELVKIEDVSKIRRGASPRPINDPAYFSEKGRGWIRISDVTSSNKYLKRTSQYLSELGVSKTVSVNPGDLIVSICATIGTPILVDIPACIHDGFVFVSEVDQRVDVNYLYYVFQSLKSKLKASGQVGTQGNLNTSIVKRLQFGLPSMPEQKGIIEILSEVDEAIQATESVIGKTQKLKKGLMQDLLTRGIGHKKFKQTEIGEIPEEWGIKKANSILSLEYGKALKKEVRKNGLFPVYGANGIVGYHNSNLVKGPGILVGRKGSVGEVWYSEKDFWPIDTTYYVSLKVKANLKWVYYLLSSLKLQSLTDQGNVPGLNRNHVHEKNIAVPSEEEQEKIVQILSHVDSKIDSEVQKRVQLETLKKGLMQDLLTGKVRVSIGQVS